MNKNIDIIKDTRVNCYSVMTQFQVEEYLKRVKNAFENRGGLEGQRDTLKTNTAIRIRKRMIKDIETGAVLPPIVIGVIIPQDNFAIIEQLEDNNAFLEFINKIPEDSISIIDGMQRTKALSVALKDNANICNHKIRVEFWIASQINSLIYRMLVLNTGQVPWDIRRQIETVFQGIIKELKEKFHVIEIITLTDRNHKNKRSSPGQFKSDDIIELFLVFGAKKVKIDIPERLAEEFTRLDFISSTSNPNLTNIFYEVMFYLYKFDQAISRYQNEEIQGYFQKGQDLFSSQPACVGFVTALAFSILGRPGNDYEPEEQNQKWQDIKNKTDTLLTKINNLNPDEIGDFLDFPTLNELISKKLGRKDFFEREFFLQAFNLLISEKFNIDNMTQCWRALY
ncbi:MULTISPECIES: hypothetical protein [Dolichospermum]|uniref:hypothetical protein n=1 Tax=Dolichospermum TaxID=748770 RepID=UPI00232FD408|nr:MULTISPECIES: hypothetical protein [Dolichospermum]MDB9436137.1 hypothetical protein [Dolichospermum lemmermannii CS-548]MDB9449504.1 hypothetical protein [Dolichospermum circinale CS-547]